MDDVTSRQRERKRGFTLTELIIVIAILAILAGILIPLLSGWLRDAKEQRLVVACRTCVTAANTIATLRFAKDGDIGYIYDEEVREYAGVDKGKCYNIAFDRDGDAETNTYVVSYLTYQEDPADDLYVTYVRTPNDHYVFSNAPDWVQGLTFQVGDTMKTNGYIFRCIRAHTTGTTSRTRNPSLRSNKSTWEVIGYTGDPLQYSSTVRYCVGMLVDHKGHTFKRTSFNLVGGQVPYNDPPRDSDYWLYVGPATP